MAKPRLRVVGLAVLAGVASGCALKGSGLPAGATDTLFPWVSPTATSRPATAPPKVSATVEAGPSATPFKHIVRANETLLQIAGLYGVSLEALRAVNPGVNPNLLSIGQELIIPNAEGTPIVALIPSATPIPLALQPPRCYPQAGGGAWCVTALRNASDDTLEDIEVGFRILDSAGEATQSQSVPAPVNFLPPGKTMPVAVLLPSAPGSGATVAAAVLHAIPANDLESRYRQPSITRDSPTAPAGGTSWVLTGSLSIPTDAPESNETRLLAIAFDAADEVVGFSVWEAAPMARPGDSVPFSTRVFTLGPGIARVDLVAETYAIQNPG
jgi:LysM repeat protein